MHFGSARNQMVHVILAAQIQNIDFETATSDAALSIMDIMELDCPPIQSGHYDMFYRG